MSKNTKVFSADPDLSPDDWWRNFWDVVERWSTGLLSTDELEMCLNKLGVDMLSCETQQLLSLYFDYHLTKE